MAPARIAVFGGGTSALLASVSLARALPHCRITLVATPAQPGAMADLSHCGHPSLAVLHERIGLNERDMLHRADATHRLAIRYERWRLDGAPFIVGHGAAIDGALAQAFAGSQASGPAAAIAAAGRFALPSDDPDSPLSDVDYALRFNPDRYRAGLSALARQLRVEAVAGTPVAIEQAPDGAIASVMLESGHMIAADLMIDATGPAASLFDIAGLNRRLDWSDRLPGDRILFSAALAQPGADPADTVTAIPEGCVVVSPGRNGTRVCLVHHAAITSPDAAAATLSRVTGASPGAFHPIAPGRIAKPFQHNLIAIGDAACTFEPLGWLNLHLATLSIELLLDLMPGSPIEALERDDYNRRWAMLADRTGDYLAAHYGAPGAPAGDYWRHAGAMSRSPGLALTLSEFERRSRLPYFEEESVARDMWVQLLVGGGFTPGASPRQLSLGQKERVAAESAQRRRIENAVAASEPYPAWLSGQLAPRR